MKEIRTTSYNRFTTVLVNIRVLYTHIFTYVSQHLIVSIHLPTQMNDNIMNSFKLGSIVKDNSITTNVVPIADQHGFTLNGLLNSF